MKKIVVFLYAYKNKALRDSVDSLLNNHSGSTELAIYVYDKNNLKRSELFNDVNYEHIMWDSIETKFDCRAKVLDKEEGDYFFAIDGSKQFCKNWDLKFIKSLDEKEILSGTNKINFNNEKYKFFVDYDKTPINQKDLTNWIDRSFIFTHFKLFKDLPLLLELKFRGEEEVLSLYCHVNDIKISAVPSDYLVEIDKNIFEYDYIPFSINHNYNYVIDLFKNKSNIFFKDEVDVINFEKKLGYDFSKLSYHPFPENDIEYNPNTSLDTLEGERFFGGIKSIY